MIRILKKGNRGEREREREREKRLSLDKEEKVRNKEVRTLGLVVL